MGKHGTGSRGIDRPELDWMTIRIGYEAGLTFPKLAEQHDTTKQCIQQRQKREGWHRTPPKHMDPEILELNRDKKILGMGWAQAKDQLGKRDDTNKYKVLDALKIGLSFVGCSRLVGMTEKDLRSWLEQDTEFFKLSQYALGRFEQTQVTEMQKSNSWQRALKQLSQNKATKDNYKDEQIQGAAGGTIQVNISIPPPLPAPSPDSVKLIFDNLDGKT